MNKGDEKNNAGILINVKVIPRAKKNEISGVMQDGSIKVRVKAPPVDGKANQALIKLLSKKLGIATSCVTIKSGARGRKKRILIEGIDQQKLQAIIGQEIQL